MPGESASAEARRRAAREVIDILHEIATLLVRPNNGALTIMPIITCILEHPSGPPAALLLRIAHREWRKSRSISREFQHFCNQCFFEAQPGSGSAMRAVSRQTHPLSFLVYLEKVCMLIMGCGTESYTAAARRISSVV
jgi:hypothetical protein